MFTTAVLRNVPLFAGMTEQELQILAGSLGRRTFAKGMIIFHKEGLGRQLYIIESGKVRIFVLSESGQEISVNIYGPGEIFGELSLLDGLPRSAGAIALEKTVTLTLDRQDFVRYLRTLPGMAPSIIEGLSKCLRYTTQFAESLAFLDVYGRVAAKLLELADRYGVQEGPGETPIELRLTQTELATWVVASRETVNKVLGAFRDQNLIEIDGQGITILDQLGLKARILY